MLSQYIVLTLYLPFSCGDLNALMDPQMHINKYFIGRGLHRETTLHQNGCPESFYGFCDYISIIRIIQNKTGSA